MGRFKYKGYSGSVEYDEGVNRLTGKVLGMKNTLLLYEGDNVEDLRKDFEEAVDDYLATCALDGRVPEKPYSGNVVVRMTTELHASAVEKASLLGISLNEFIKRAVLAAL